MKILIIQFLLLMLLTQFTFAAITPAIRAPGEPYAAYTCASPDQTLISMCRNSYPACWHEVRSDCSTPGHGYTARLSSCPSGTVADSGKTGCYSCPEGTTPVPGDPSQCDDGEPEPPVCPEEGDPAGIDEGADGPPGYATKCYDGCSVIGYEYFQRTDNDLWVISYIYTGTECGDGDPMGEPTAPPGTPMPNPITPTTDKDTSGDGVPDHASDDIDGDGVSNSQDPDIDGDGIPNEDDPTPWGRPASEEPSKANTSQNCSQHPSCSGDAIQCAQLVEIWRLRCKTSPPNTQEISESLDDDIIAGSVNAGEQALQNASDEIIGALDDDSGISLSTDLQNPITALFNGVTCTDIGFEFEGNAFNISCTDTQLMREVMAFILYVTTIVYLYQLARKPVEN